MSTGEKLRYVFEIQYKGSNYFGWQIQPKQKAIQEEIQEKLQLLFQDESIQIVGCGRTDTGVHAHQYFFHVDLVDLYTTEILFFKLNRMFPHDIAIKQIYANKPDFHARFDASRRVYRYFVHQEKNPFLNEQSLYFNKTVDFEAMNKACIFLLGTQDFTSFSKVHTDVKTNICTITSAQWIEYEAGKYYFEIAADRFLRNMVRAIVGTLLEVGQGKITPETIQTILAAQDRGAAKMSAPAHGLFLWEINYPNLL